MHHTDIAQPAVPQATTDRTRTRRSLQSLRGRTAAAAVVALLVGMGGLSNLGSAVAAAQPSSYTPGFGTGSGYCASAENGGHPLSGSPNINGVYPCGPLPINNGDSGPAIPTFWPVNGASGGFQCTEYAQRYLYTLTHGDLDSFSDLSGEVFASRAAKQFRFTSPQMGSWRWGP